MFKFHITYVELIGELIGEQNEPSLRRYIEKSVLPCMAICSTYIPSTLGSDIYYIYINTNQNQSDFK